MKLRPCKSVKIWLWKLTFGTWPTKGQGQCRPSCLVLTPGVIHVHKDQLLIHVQHRVKLKNTKWNNVLKEFQHSKYFFFRNSHLLMMVVSLRDFFYNSRLLMRRMLFCEIFRRSWFTMRAVSRTLPCRWWLWEAEPCSRFYPGLWKSSSSGFLSTKSMDFIN